MGKHMKMRLAISSLLLSLAALVSSAQADHRRIRIGYASFTPAMATLWVAKERQFFEKNDLDVELIAIQGGAPTVQATIAGDLAFGMASGIPVVVSAIQGSGGTLLAGIINTLPYQLFAAKGITRVEQLKGKKLAVARFGGPADYAARFVIAKSGLKPVQDVALLQIGGHAERLAAVIAGSVEAALIEPPQTLIARKAGLNLIADVPQMGLEAQHTSLFTTKSFIANHPRTTQATMKALVQAIHFYRTRKEETMKIFAKYMRIDDREALGEAHEHYIQKGIPRKPYPTLQGVQSIIDGEAEKNPKARGLKAEQFVDLRFLQQLDQSGYIDSLYK